jgi:hypothetical protein
MTMPVEILLLALASFTFAIARALAPQAPDARDGELETPQHRDTSPRPNTPGAEGARFDSAGPYGEVSVCLGLIAALFALWFVLSGWVAP